MSNSLRRTLVIIAVILVATLCLLLAYSTTNNRSLARALQKAGMMSSYAEGFEVTSWAEDVVVAQDGGEKVRIRFVTKLDRDGADEHRQSEESLLSALFDPQLPPYPEFLTNETGCEAKYKPSAHDHPLGRYYILYAGERLGYGICANDLVAYRASIGFFYCEEAKTFAKVEYFVAKGEDSQKLIHFNDSLTCL